MPRTGRIGFFVLLVLCAGHAYSQTGQSIQTDPATGRAIGAKEMSAAELRAKINQKTKTLVIDVRDPEEFKKETIKGAVNIPLLHLNDRLKDIPHDTTLVFT